MNNKNIIFFIILITISIGSVYAENNTESIHNPTMNILGDDTVMAIEGGDSNISFTDGYKGYCAEWGEHSAEEGQIFYTEPTSIMNSSNYLKTMFLFFYNQTQKDVYSTQHMVWKFTDDKQFSRFNQTWYNQIVGIGDKYTIPDQGVMLLNNTHQFEFSFKALIAQINEYQNFFSYKFSIVPIPDNSTIQINNSTINNSTIIIPEYQNNDTNITYNDTYTIDDQISHYTSTSDNLNILGINKKTGANLWLLGCVIIIIFAIAIIHKREPK